MGFIHHRARSLRLRTCRAVWSFGGTIRPNQVRPILDNLLGNPWEQVLEASPDEAHHQLSETQVREAIALAHSIVRLPDNCLHQLNRSSLHWRNQTESH